MKLNDPEGGNLPVGEARKAIYILQAPVYRALSLTRLQEPGTNFLSPPAMLPL